MSSSIQDPNPETEAEGDSIESLLSSDRRVASNFTLKNCTKKPSKQWDDFYKAHQQKFFKDRHWTDTEFNALKLGNANGKQKEVEVEDGDEETDVEESLRNSAVESGVEKNPVLLEVGCGVGNMCFPVSLERILDECPASRIFNLLPDPIIFQLNPKLESHLFPIKHQLLEKNPNLIVHCCDFSPRAIELVKASFTLFSSLADSPTIFHFSKMTFSQFPLSPCIQSHPSYDPSRVHAFVHDLTSSPSLLPSILSSSSLPSPTFISCIFVLSAIPPTQHLSTLQTLVDQLPEGGSLLFRDYAYGDLAQIRFHPSNSLGGKNMASNKNKWEEPNLLDGEKHWYRRGDGTMTYFFGEEELKGLGEKVGLNGEVKVLEKVVRNRKLETEMKRRWMQVEWKKV